MLYSHIHTHTHTESKLMVNGERFLSLRFIIKAASQGESQGEIQEVERNKKKMDKTRYWIHHRESVWCHIIDMTIPETKQC